MSGHVVIDDHDDLIDVGSLRHAELDKIILEGLVPTLSEGLSPPNMTQERTVGIPLLPSNNVFLGDNTFGTVNINGDLNVFGTRNEISVANLDIENTVITLGYGTGGELPSSDRGVIFTAAGPNPSIFWDHDQAEFRFALVDVDPTVTEFPDPEASGHGGYADIKVGDIVASSLNTPIINSLTANIQALNADALVIATSVDATAASVDMSSVNIANASVDQLKTFDGTQDYLSRYIKPGAGVSIDPDPQDPGSFKVSVSRQKESLAPGQFLPANSVFSSSIISSMTEHTNENLDVYVNGVLVSMGTNFDYTIDSSGLKFYFALEPDDVITIISY